MAERPARRSVTVEMPCCCTNNANRSLVSLRSTVSNCHVLFGYLHSREGVVCHPIPTTSEVLIPVNYADMKDDAKYRKWGHLEYLGRT